MIEVKGLVKFYGARKVLHELNFTVSQGSVCGFLGPNGSGKSTTMDILASLLGPSEGSIKVCGFDAVTQAKDVKQHVGYLPDNPPLYKEMRVEEFVTYVAKLRGLTASSKRKAAVQLVMEECDVVDVRNRIIGNLSKGYRQRVALCAALIHRPHVLILDEPTEGLDPNQILHIRNLIKKLSSDRTVILSSHILSEVQATCDEAIIINHGNIVSKVNISSMDLKSSCYQYTFVNKVENALQWFHHQPSVQSAKINGKKQNSILVEFNKNNFAGTDTIAAITEQLVQQKFPLIGIEEKKTGIEELFFEVIQPRMGEHPSIIQAGEIAI